MVVDVLVLPSPLLGPAAYGPLAAALTDQGAPALVAHLPEGPFGPTEVLAAFVDQLRDSGASTVVAHSNAGYYVPAVRARVPVPVAVLVDAALPLGSGATTALAPPAFAELVARLPQEDGRLPPWPRWWDPADVAALFPSPQWLARVTDEAPRLPPAYLTATVEVPPRWAEQPAAYLAFGDTYAAELAFARTAGWPVEQVEGHHLQLLAEPAATARAVLGLRERT